jgi:cation-transporting ATPase F
MRPPGQVNRTQAVRLLRAASDPSGILYSEPANPASATQDHPVEQMAGRGLRVLPSARREVGDGHNQLHHHRVRDEFTYLGLQGMIDPQRAEAIVQVRKCQEAGMRVKRITGDHALTARSISIQLGLRACGDAALIAVTGSDLKKVSDTGLPEFAKRASGFARIAPEQKLKLVRALQSRCHIVAMTGDGVNDARALKQAAIRVAMGITGP